MRAKSIVRYMKAALTNNRTRHRPIWLWGAPGGGKSAIVKSAAKEIGLRVIDRRAVTFDPVDVRGVPHVGEWMIGDQAVKSTDWAIPAMFLRLGEEPTVLFLDEFAQAAPTVQSAFLQLVLDRCLDEFLLPDNVVIVAASNRQEDRAGSNRVITPMLSRFIHVDFEVNLEDFTKWGIGNGLRGEVFSYLNYKPDQLMTFDPKSPAKAFACPRTWEFASDQLFLDLPIDILQEALAGTIGAGTASDFCAFLEVHTKLPTVDDIRKNAKTMDVPKQPDICWATIGMLVEAMRNDKTMTEPAVEYMLRMMPEYATMAAKSAIVANPAVLHLRSFKEFTKDNAELLC